MPIQTRSDQDDRRQAARVRKRTAGSRAPPHDTPRKCRSHPPKANLVKAGSSTWQQGTENHGEGRIGDPPRARHVETHTYCSRSGALSADRNTSKSWPRCRCITPTSPCPGADVDPDLPAQARGSGAPAHVSGPRTGHEVSTITCGHTAGVLAVDLIVGVEHRFPPDVFSARSSLLLSRICEPPRTRGEPHLVDP